MKYLLFLLFPLGLFAQSSPGAMTQEQVVQALGFMPVRSDSFRIDWNKTSGMGMIHNKPVSDMARWDAVYNWYMSGVGYYSSSNPPSWSVITSKPTIPDAQVNSDWNSNSGVSQILNKPTIPTNNNQLTNGAGYLTGVTWSIITSKPTTLSGYGITDGYTNANARSAISLTTTGTSGAASYNSSTGVFNIPNYIPATKTINDDVARSFVSTAAAANGFQVSSTRDSDVRYSVKVSCAVQIGVVTNVEGYIVLEVAPTNSSTASDWKEKGRITNGQNIGIALALSSTQVTGGQISALVPAGYYVRLRTVNVSGTPTYTYGTGVETLY